MLPFSLELKQRPFRLWKGRYVLFILLFSILFLYCPAVCVVRGAVCAICIEDWRKRRAKGQKENVCFSGIAGGAVFGKGFVCGVS